jgi:RHS repeat-associated protein
VLVSEAYDFKGNLLHGVRQLAAGYREAPDWSGSPALEAETFRSSTAYDALNRPVALTTPDGGVVRPSYNEAKLLERLEANLRGAADATPFVRDVDYNARGQRVSITYDNGVSTSYEYDRLTFRLARLRTTRGATRLQDLAYTYDIAGNITHIRDDAQQAVYFNNAVAEAHAAYSYDAVYRLVAATGREHIGQAAQPETSRDDQFRVRLQHPHNGQAMRRYGEQYDYDAVGNLLRLVHQASGGSWTREYAYDERSQLEPAGVSNRLSRTAVGGTVEPYGHDDHGNMVAMPGMALMRWNFKDQLQSTARQVVGDDGTPETTFYVYDGAGERVRKVTESQSGTRLRERIYLGGLEIFRAYSGGATVALERETLHVIDDRQRVALVETRTAGGDDAPARGIRYQLGNHLGSACLELGAGGAVISYEEYYPYGSTSYQAGRSAAEMSLKRYRYTGKEHDTETGLCYHGARYYAPWLGRWTAADPVGLGDGPNIYAYGRNNPAVLIDPSGTTAQTVTVHSDPDLAYYKNLEAYTNSVRKFNVATKDLENNLSNYTPAVRQDIEDSIEYTRRQLRQQHKALVQEGRNLPAARVRFRVSQMLAAKEREQVQRTFRNAAGFVNRFALFVVTSVAATSLITGGLGVQGVRAAVLEGGTGSFVYGSGEELISQSETGESLDVASALEAGAQSGAIGAATGGLAYGAGMMVGKFVNFFRGKPQTIGEALELGLPQSRPSAEKAADTALRNKRSSGAAAELTRDGVVLTTGVSGKPVPPNDAVTGVLMGTPKANRAPWHGGCAEVASVDKALNAGIDVQGASMRAVNIGKSGAGHHTTKEICSSCKFLLKHFGIKWTY